MKILFISYYFDPFSGVGSKRISYWVNQLYEESKKEIFPTVITATNPEGNMAITQNINFDHIYIPDNKKPFLNSFINFDPGYSWYPSLKEFFLKIEKFEYDFVLLTGNPFLHFYISIFLKKKFNAKIILDFRDPFSNNPLFKKSNFFKKMIKKNLEKTFIKNADIVITVNKYCLDLLEINSKVECSIIENGYDERYINKLIDVDLNKKYINFVYSGKISIGRDSSFLIDLLESNSKYLIHYFGDDYYKVPYHPRILNYGYNDYRTVLSYIDKCDYGIVISSGENFESTTKIFDYIGMRKKILVFSKNTLQSGSIFEIGEGYESTYFFSEENKDNLDLLMNKINQKEILYPFDRFSRREGLNRLINLVKKYDS